MSEKNHSTENTSERKKIRSKTIIFDTDFLDDPKVLQLTGQFGAAGLGMFLRLLTALGREGGHASVTAVSHLGLAIGVARDDFEAFVRACVDLELVVEADGQIISPRLLADANALDQKRKSWRDRQKVSRVSHASVTDMSEEETETETEHEPELDLNLGGAGGASVEQPAEPERLPPEKKPHGWREGTQSYGEFYRVWLTDYEYERLRSAHGSEQTNLKIAALDAEIETGNRKYRAYKNHYATLGKWLRSDAERARAGPPRRASESYLAGRRVLLEGLKKGTVTQQEFETFEARNR